MERQLNIAAFETAMTRKGLTQTSIAEKLGLTRASVSKWFTGKSFPRPPELLKLGKLLGLSYGELVEIVRSATARTLQEPLIAFRKRAGTKTTDTHIAHAKEMGRLLMPVVPHLSFDKFLAPSRLKRPSCDYEYLQNLVIEVRRELKLSDFGPIDFKDLIGKFKAMQAVVVPVMWGEKSRHENALHIYLPESQTTWIFLNLDSNLHDFKFWMAHELGHVLSVSLLESGEEDFAEDFSDAFAGALLFPKVAARAAYECYAEACRWSLGAGMDKILKAARQYVISPLTIYKEIKKLAMAETLPFEPLPDKLLYPVNTSFNKEFSSVSEILFDGKTPSADQFMRICSEIFKTPFFVALGNYLKAAPNSDYVVSRILDIPLIDAREIRNALL